MAETHLPKSKFGWNLNPGHYIAADEWVSTPFMPGSDVKLRSGNYIQFDLIIAPDRPYFGADLEDGIVLADEELRAGIKAKSPGAWARFERRRRDVYKRQTTLLSVCWDNHGKMLSLSKKSCRMPDWNAA